MEFIADSGIKVPNAVIVSGLLESAEDEEIIDFPKKYGSFRLVSVTDARSEFYKNLIIEYHDGAAIEALTSRESNISFKLWPAFRQQKLVAMLPKPTSMRSRNWRN